MAYTQPGTAVTGGTALASFWNTHVRDNLNALVPTATTTAASWSPVLKASTTDPLVSSTSSRQWRVGPMQWVFARFVATGGGGASGTFFVTLPVNASGVSADATTGQVLGTWAARDASASSSYVGAVILAAAGQVRFLQHQGSASVITQASPFEWGGPDAGGIGDVLTFTACYPVA